MAQLIIVCGSTKKVYVNHSDKSTLITQSELYTGDIYFASGDRDKRALAIYARGFN